MSLTKSGDYFSITYGVKMLNNSVYARVLFILLILIIAVAAPPFPTRTLNAQMLALSEIQNGIFFLSHKNISITSETFYNDRYIDDVQARLFSDASRTEPYVEADKDYPFTLVDHFILNSDLSIAYQYDSIFEIYPAKAFLSRHNISIADYTSQKSPPEVFRRVVNAKEPFRQDKVKAVTWVFNNYEYEQDEFINDYIFQNGPWPKANSGIDGYKINTTIRIKSGIISVWVHDISLFPYHPYVKPYIKPCTDCLPKSDYPEPEVVARKVNWISYEHFGLQQTYPYPYP